MVCKKHPKYKAIRKPRVDCLDCWNMYADALEKEGKRLEKLISDIEREIEDLAKNSRS